MTTESLTLYQQTSSVKFKSRRGTHPRPAQEGTNLIMELIYFAATVWSVLFLTGLTVSVLTGVALAWRTWRSDRSWSREMRQRDKTLKPGHRLVQRAVRLGHS